jgi:hypothetical protein
MRYYLKPAKMSVTQEIKGTTSVGEDMKNMIVM